MRKSAWSLDIAMRDALFAHGVPKHLRKGHRREQIIDRLQPPDLLEEWRHILDRLPENLRDHAEQIFVLAPARDPELTPYAVASGDKSRRVVVPRSFYWIQRLFSAARVEVERPLQSFLAVEAREREKIYLPPGEALTRITNDSRRFASEHEPSDLLHKLLYVLKEVGTHPESVVSIPKRYEELQLGSWRVELESRSGLRFALGHEVGHHLMNHTWRRANATTLGAEAVLQSWLSSIDLDMPRLPPVMLMEIMCDGFAAMLAHAPNADDDPLSAWVSSVMLAGGSLSSLLALALFGESAPDRTLGWPFKPLNEDSHPSFEVRSRFLADILLRVAPDHPDGPTVPKELGRPVTGSADGYALLVLGSSTAVQELMHALR